MKNIEWLRKAVEECLNYKDEINFKKRIVNAQILYTKMKNANIEDDKSRLIILYQSALSKFIQTEIGKRYKNTGWLEPGIAIDTLHNLINNSKTCKIMDEIDEEYDIDLVEDFAKVIEGPESYIIDVIEAYNHFYYIMAKERKQIENSFDLIRRIVGSEALEKVESFQEKLMETGFYNGNPSESKNIYKNNWQMIRDKVESLYKEQKILDEDNYIYVIDTINAIEDHYCNGPQVISDVQKDSVITYVDKHFKRAYIS